MYESALDQDLSDKSKYADRVWSSGTVQDSGVLDHEFEPC